MRATAAVADGSHTCWDAAPPRWAYPGEIPFFLFGSASGACFLFGLGTSSDGVLEVISLSSLISHLSSSGGQQALGGVSSRGCTPRARPPAHTFCKQGAVVNSPTHAFRGLRI